MKRPDPPPSSNDLFQIFHDRRRFIKARAAVRDPLVGGEYVHWDRLRRLRPPDGLSLEDWWYGLKLVRGVGNCVPLKDKTGQPFKFNVMGRIPEHLHEIDLGAGGFVQMPEQITNPETKDRYYVGSLIEEAITSSQLEGAATTRRVAKDMIRSGRKPRDRSEKMILNNYLTMQRIGEIKDEPLTPELVFQIHRLVTEGTLDDATAAGRFRRDDERVRVEDAYGEVFHEPPPASQLADRMAAMCDFANGKTPGEFVHPALRSIILHFWLAYDHPFQDGNGRTARALFYWSMLHHRYWLCEFISISSLILKAPAEYERAFLYTETDDNDLTYFIIYHLELIRRAVDELHKYIARKTEQLRRVERELRGIADLNYRQRAIISHALRHPHQTYTIESHRRSHDVVYETARRDLHDLADRKLLNAAKVRKTWQYTPASDLEKRLAGLG
jgi:Fic family protein